MEIKVCTKCKKELLVDNFGKNKNKKDGLDIYCKECNKEHYQSNKGTILEQKKQYYQENKTIIAKQKKQYHENNKEHVADCRKKYRQNSKVVISKQNKQYRTKNKVAIAKYRKKYQRDNIITIAEYQTQYRQENKTIIAGHMKLWQQENLEKCRTHHQQYKARKRLLPSTLTKEQWENVKQHFNNSCCYCGKELPLEQEHFIALSKMGEYTHNNIVPACRSCNSSKHNNTFFEWYPTYKYYSKKREISILEFLNYKNSIQQLALSF